MAHFQRREEERTPVERFEPLADQNCSEGSHSSLPVELSRPFSAVIKRLNDTDGRTVDTDYREMFEFRARGCFLF